MLNHPSDAATRAAQGKTEREPRQASVSFGEAFRYWLKLGFIGLIGTALFAHGRASLCGVIGDCSIVYCWQPHQASGHNKVVTP